MQSQKISSGGKTPSKVQVLHDFVFSANQNAKQVKRETKSLDPITKQTRHNSKAMDHFPNARYQRILGSSSPSGASGPFGCHLKLELCHFAPQRPGTIHKQDT